MTPRLIRAADLFCGAGGTSTGLAEACASLGFGIDLTAVNHWSVAIATHTSNHPEARHLCTGLDSVNPRDLFAEDSLDLLWASPECTHHSVARGGRPMSDQSRSTAWCVVRWAEALRPKVILIENVPEFLTWGPIGEDGRPVKDKKGNTFNAWREAVDSLGFVSDYRILRAADYGDPTTRRRLFVQFARVGHKITWPAPTHAEKPTPEQLAAGIKPWRAAREIIDWSLTGSSIFTRKRPLSDKTLRRIEAGLRKFGLKDFVVAWDHQSSPVGEWSADQPLGTVTTKQRHGLIQPYLVQVAHAGDDAGRARGIEEPLPTVAGNRGEWAAVQPFLITTTHGNSGKKNSANWNAHDVGVPLGTVTSASERGLVQPFLVKYHGDHAGRQDSAERVLPVDAPLPTLDCSNRVGLAQPFLVEMRGSSDPHINATAKSVDAPMPTLTAGGQHVGLCEPFIVEYYGTGGPASVDKPMGTATTRPRFGLVMPVVEIAGQRYQLDIRFRMLQPHELAAAQGFPSSYKFEGNKTEVVKQIGNAVPCGLSRALGRAVLSQSSAETPNLTILKAAS